ncbi:hypothetical protein SAMN07250955_12110 [Arboricoccus pini]|uniref:Xaa-Pro dipeptidyl-peptidase C-terminal domain-containing protein n=1 Tax=Arboricoccus pini TaxID=1963835 RepID=A0A212S2Z4_9PROT|nr:CocE/NonD family hydrolase [Arboricoccus pini]SNB79394.1 hypothetical protein SAMN07250955_12110 [Arboricoccus pini]
MTVRTDFPRAVRTIENMWIPLSDGCRLAARLWLPEDALEDPVPAVLEYLPYRKRDGTVWRDALQHPYMAGFGYGCVRVDMRGNGDSDGIMLDEYLKQEQDDALEVIAWLAAQPWCTGAVGMMGISWGGFNGLQVAARRPPALKAIITLCSTVDRFAEDIHYKGGCLLNENLGWAATMLAYSSRPPDPALVGDRWRAMWLDRLENESILLDTWMRHQTRDAYWRHGSVCEDYAAIEAATLAVGGWNDSYKNAVPALVQNLKAPAKGIIGPWIHKYPEFAAPEPRIGFLQEAVRWWDRWLKGVANGAEDDPAYRVFMMDSEPPKGFYAKRAGEWVAEPALPSPGVAPLAMTLGRGTLATTAPADQPDLSIRSPQDCGMASGEYCAIWLGPELPLDQREDDAGSLCFDTKPLPEPLAIMGRARVRLAIASDKAAAFVAVRLCDVAPDGASARITYGILNLCHARSHAAPEPLEPGRVYDVELLLDEVAYKLAAGHRLRLAVSSAYWPMIWPSPERATLTVTTARSGLDLPLRVATSLPAPTFAPPETATPWAATTLRQASHVRRFERDVVAGRSRLVIEDDFGAVRDDAHGLVTDEVARETWEIGADDPLTAEGRAHWSERLARDGWEIRTETYSSLRADRDAFHVRARIEAYEGDRLVYERDHEARIPRELI